MKKYIKYAVGNPGFRGRTTVEIDQQGRALVTFLQGDISNHYESVLDDATIMEINTVLEEHFSDGPINTAKTRVPDEDLVTIHYGEGSDSNKLEFPANLVYTDARLQRIQETFSDLIRSVSNNKLKY